MATETKQPLTPKNAVDAVSNEESEEEKNRIAQEGPERPGKLSVGKVHDLKDNEASGLDDEIKKTDEAIAKGDKSLQVKTNHRALVSMKRDFQYGRYHRKALYLYGKQNKIIKRLVSTAAKCINNGIEESAG
jgi:hypothetical protein